MTENTQPLTRSLEDFAKANAIGLYLSSWLEDLPDVTTYDRIQEDPEYLHDCLVWEVFGGLGNDTIAGLLYHQYTQNLADYQAVHDKAQAELYPHLSALHLAVLVGASPSPQRGQLLEQVRAALNKIESKS